jgi:hypothetical protein
VLLIITNYPIVRQRWLDVQRRRRQATQRPTTSQVVIHLIILMAKLLMGRDLVLNLLSSPHRELAVYMGSTLQRMQKVEISTRTLMCELLMW